VDQLRAAGRLDPDGADQGEEALRTERDRLRGVVGLLDQVVGYLVCLDTSEFAEQRRVVTVEALIQLAKDYRALAAQTANKS
jgi:hypothetical protein